MRIELALQINQGIAYQRKDHGPGLGKAPFCFQKLRGTAAGFCDQKRLFLFIKILGKTLVKNINGAFDAWHGQFTPAAAEAWKKFLFELTAIEIDIDIG